MTTEPRRGRRRVLVLGTGAAAVVIGAGTAAAVGFGGGAAPQSEDSTLPPATAAAERTTLTATEQVSGTLGYGTARTLSAHGSGVLTWLPEPGSVIGRGKPLYEVDELPITVLRGSIPAYRPLASGVSGKDVRQLEENLSALGYTGFTVDDSYTGQTADAVRDWQADLGRTETGTVKPNEIVVLPGDVRVADTLAAAGDPATGKLLDYTGTTRTVTVALDVAKQQLVEKGIAATVTLPDGTSVPGTVADVGTVASAPQSDNGAESGAAQQESDEPATIEVVVTVADQAELGTLDSAPVDVTLVSEKRPNVVAVPVGALVALAEGGYGVQVVKGRETRYVAVQTGMFADGKVEVSGIEPGTVVGVPR
jgi:hypothetical protein